MDISTKIEIRKKLCSDVFHKFMKAYECIESELTYITDFKFALEFYIVPDEDAYNDLDPDFPMPNVFHTIESIFDLSHLSYTASQELLQRECDRDILYELPSLRPLW